MKTHTTHHQNQALSNDNNSEVLVLSNDLLEALKDKLPSVQVTKGLFEDDHAEVRFDFTIEHDGDTIEIGGGLDVYVRSFYEAATYTHPSCSDMELEHKSANVDYYFYFNNEEFTFADTQREELEQLVAEKAEVGS